MKKLELPFVIGQIKLKSVNEKPKLSLEYLEQKTNYMINVLNQHSEILNGLIKEDK